MSLRVCEAHRLKPVEEWLTEGARVCGRPAGAHGLKPVTQGVWGELTG